jgi:hypothetical protein
VIPTSNQDGCQAKNSKKGGGFRREDLNVIFYQNMPNLDNRYISAEKKNSQKNPEYKKWPKLLYFKPECAQI